ncbi:Disintegrin and metalloproteinase domain-containing protein 17 [Blomia tropicalis]|nr:Disintegrin and metalloproteinase domain-containing protein 17 [Blomia tropicalis]
MCILCTPRPSKPQSSYIISPSSTDYFQDYLNNQFSAKHLIKRTKRQAIKQTNCATVIFIDKSLFRRMNHDKTKLILLVNFIFRTAEKIFRNTKFTISGETKSKENENEPVYENYGHVLCKIILPSGWPTINNVLSFLNGSSSWTQNNLYQALNELDNHSSYCLAYLFTNLEITKPQANGIATLGGIMSNRMSKPNVGAVSLFRCQDPWDYYCTLAFVHELGHSWGAEHDTDNDKCIPKHNGSYIMSIPFQYSFGENNFEFSPCSIKAIYQNIKTINPKEFECNK